MVHALCWVFKALHTGIEREIKIKIANFKVSFEKPTVSIRKK